MSLLWTDPQTYTIQQTLTASDMNKISDNERYLYERPYKLITVRGTGSNITTTSASFVAVDDAQFSYSLEVNGAMIETNILAALNHSVTNGLIYFDILMDGTTWLSSLTTTALTNGIWQATRQGAVQAGGNMQPYRIEAGAIPAGIHTFALRWRTSAATATLALSTGNLFQWYLGEHS